MDNWLKTLEEFSAVTRTERFPQMHDAGDIRFGLLCKRIQRGCHYRLYIGENLDIINPYSTKKDEGKKVIKTIIDTMSREGAIEKAYYFIVKTAFELGLYEESVCDSKSSNRILQQSMFSEKHCSLTMNIEEK